MGSCGGVGGCGLWRRRRVWVVGGVDAARLVVVGRLWAVCGACGSVGARHVVVWVAGERRVVHWAWAWV
eukprot:15467205-Alexandrium_andersonii.AAC.1